MVCAPPGCPAAIPRCSKRRSDLGGPPELIEWTK